MTKWKQVTKTLAMVGIVGVMLFGSATSAFAYSDESTTAAQVTETQEAETQTDGSSDTTEAENSSSGQEDHVLEVSEDSENSDDADPAIDRGNAFTTPGNATVQDDVTDGSSKEFLTIVTKNNQTFYVIIDRSSNTNNVYMLSAVDENDLQEFLTDDVADGKTGLSGSVLLPAENEKEATDVLPTANDQADDIVKAADDTASDSASETPSAQTTQIGILAIAAAAALAAGYYFKIVKPRKNAAADAGNEGLEDMEDYNEVDEDEE